MLSELRITGLGVIDEAIAEFAPGLTVLTGETGAGKTMVVTGLRLLAGGRADPGRVRRGADKAVVEGRFDVDRYLGDSRVGDGRKGDDPLPRAAAELQRLLDDEDVERDEDGSVIAIRRVGADGRSRARLGGRSVPAGTLARFCGPLLAVHGQNDQLRLLRGENQRDAVDSHGGPDTAAALAAYRDVHRRWTDAERSLAERTERSRELAQEADLLSFGLREIDELSPEPGEDEALDTRIQRLTDSEALRDVALAGQDLLAGGDGDTEPVTSALDHLSTRLAAAGDPRLDEIADRIADAVATLGDAGTELALYLAELPDDATGELDEAIGRRQGIKALTRKYGTDVDEVLAWAARARARLVEVDTSDSAVDALRADVDRLRAELVAAGSTLTAARRAAAADLSARVSAELAELSMGGAALVVDVRPAGGGPAATPTASGLDEVEFALDGPSGPVPLARGASGGELSRVMLALEVVLAEGSAGGTLVFDEVDAGVGGRAALSIGRRLALLARRHQVIAVTHLAQVAAYADTHLSVRKGEATGTDAAISGVVALDRHGRITELARMLAGMEETDTGLAHAQELLDTASSDRG